MLARKQVVDKGRSMHEHLNHHVDEAGVFPVFQARSDPLVGGWEDVDTSGRVQFDSGWVAMRAYIRQGLMR